MSSTQCVRCSNKIHPIGTSMQSIQCEFCGALYACTGRNIGEKQINYSFEFRGFGCIHKEIFKDFCANSCPGPGMYCEQHLSDEEFKKAHSAIKHSEKRLEETKNTLAAMKESKRLWLVNKMSGINEQDNTISEGQDGQD